MQTVTFEEMIQAREELGVARQNFSLKYHAFLVTVLNKAGFLNKLVQIKGSDLRGQFRITTTMSSRYPWEIKFHPLTKSGEVSMKSKYLTNFYNWNENTLTEQLLKIAEVVGDES